MAEQKLQTRRITILTVAALLVGAVLAMALAPRLRADSPAPALDSVVPKEFSGWTYIPSSTIQVDQTLTPGRTNLDQPYDDILSRTYAFKDGTRIMLTLAYGARQRQEVKIHRPELCYPAQGLKVLDLKPASFPAVPERTSLITGKRMIAASGPGTVELVSYWIRIGATYSDSAWVTRLTILKEGLAGKMTDGILVRASQRVPAGGDYDAAFRKQEQFLADLVAATPAAGRNLIAR